MSRVITIPLFLQSIPRITSFLLPPPVVVPLYHSSLSSSSPVTSDAGKLNPLVSSVKISKTVEVFSLVKELQAEGKEVTSLCVGEPDFPPPAAVLAAATRALSDGETKYTAVTGTVSLRNAIADDLQKRKGVTYDAGTEIVVGNGAKQCVFQGLLATCGTGDSVVIPSPYWPSYPEMATLAGAEPVILETKREDGYLIDPSALRSCLKANPNAKMLILCNPSNPTGGVHDAKRLKDLALVLEEFPNVFVLADEIYERLVYVDDDEGDKTSALEGERHTSFASISSAMRDRTLTINGFSKAYAMTGFRLGYVAAPIHIAKAITTIQSQLTSCAGSISQAAGVAALRDVTEEEMESNVVAMKGKRDYVLGRLEQMSGVTVAVPPNGAFYVLPDVSQFFEGDDTDLCLRLLTDKGLALVPGSSFGAPGTVRISYATSLAELGVAMNKLQEFLNENLPSSS